MSIELIKPFREKNNFLALWIFLSTFISFILLFWLSYKAVHYSIWWLFIFVFPLQTLHARLFVIMHDCGHHSFTNSKFLNNVIGHLCGLFYLTPFYMWRQLHNRHHLFQGHLDQRGKSLDIWLLTTEEFEKSSPLQKLLYKFYRYPFIQFFISPLVLFIFIFRVPFENFNQQAKFNIFILNLGLALLLLFFINKSILISSLITFGPILILNFSLASWLFYIQHTFEESIWLKSENHTIEKISFKGSSYYQLPRFLNWMTANIGYHHIHHLDTNIPLYHLKKAHLAISNNYYVQPIKLKESLKFHRLKLWNEKTFRLVPFRQQNNSLLD